ncbi:hypothetical protein Droror1_Dr00000108 [Drosera rotundifolia]
MVHEVDVMVMGCFMNSKWTPQDRSIRVEINGEEKPCSPSEPCSPSLHFTRLILLLTIAAASPSSGFQFFSVEGASYFSVQVPKSVRIFQKLIGSGRKVILVFQEVVSSHNVVSNAVILARKVFKRCNNEIQDVKELEMLPAPRICIFLFDVASPDEG